MEINLKNLFSHQGKANFPQKIAEYFLSFTGSKIYVSFLT